jgi:transcriptional regulator GlxA family with amidase domain
MAPGVLVVYVGFRPGGLHRLLGIPMIELLDYPLDSSLIFGGEVDDVIQRINEAKDDNSAVHVVESFLLSKVRKLRRLLPFDHALYQLANLQELPPVDNWAHYASMSVRQLERYFKERMGMSPKLFIKLIRFSRAWSMREKNSDISWNKIAHACNYADHMHMIREFKQFSGATPGELQRNLNRTPLRLQADLDETCRF